MEDSASSFYRIGHFPRVMYSFIRVAVAALAVLSCLCSCGFRNEGVVQEVAEQDFALDRDASIRIANPCGSVSIRGSDSDTLHLRTTKKSGTSEQIKNIGVQVNAEHDDVAIKTTLLPQKGKPYFGSGDSVDYELTLPRTVKIQRLEVDNGEVLLEGLEKGEVRANIVDGRVTVQNCYGDLRLEIQNGTLELAYDGRKTPTSTIAARVLSGSARLTLGASAAFHVAAATPGGNITSNLNTMVQVNGGSLRKSDFSVGKPPRSEIQLRVIDGDISIVGAPSGVARLAAGDSPAN